MIGVVVGTGLAFWQWERIWYWLSQPIASKKLQVAFIATSPLETMTTSLKVSLIAGFFFSFPWVLWQVWRFIAPGLFTRERYFFFGTFFSALIMFLIGGAFCYYVVLPQGLTYLATYMQGAITQSWRQSEYSAFIIQFLLAFGLLFELPVVTFVLGRLGLITARSMWGFFRFAIVFIFIAAALLTPGPDPVSQIMMALPLCLLYILSIGVCALAQPRTPKPSLAEGET